MTLVERYSPSMESGRFYDHAPWDSPTYGTKKSDVRKPDVYKTKNHVQIKVSLTGNMNR